jgi:hypothetical protein
LNSVITSDTKRYFTGWSGNYTSSSANGSIKMDTPKTLTANWRSEFLLTINSDYGEPVGTGWYEEGENVSISVEPVLGFIIRHFFTGWSGDLTVTESSTGITMTSPKAITANWETDYLQLYILIIIIVIVIGGGAAAVIIFLRHRKKKPVVKTEPIPEIIPVPPPAPSLEQKPAKKPVKKPAKKPEEKPEKKLVKKPKKS